MNEVVLELTGLQVIWPHCHLSGMLVRTSSNLVNEVYHITEMRLLAYLTILLGEIYKRIFVIKKLFLRYKNWLVKTINPS